MINKIKKSATRYTRLAKDIIRPEIIAGVIVGATIIAVTINTSGVILQNYSLEKQVREAEQRVAVAQLELETQKLRNEYYKTDAFLEIAARKTLNKGLEGEKLIIIPRSVALSRVQDAVLDEDAVGDSAIKRLNNFQKWMKFIQGELQYLED